MSAALKARLTAAARDMGFVASGVCRPDAIPDAPARLSAFVEAGHHGQMDWMARRTGWRANPAALWPDAQSVVMLAESYSPDHDPLDDVARRSNGAVSVYAQGRDYHDVVKKRLKRLGRWLLEQPDAAGAEIKVFVDTAPVMEKPLAQAAGLGWQGKHTNLLGRGIGNWVFLGAIFTTVNMPPDPPETDHCGSCRACLDICPTDAFPAPYRLDARRCVSYLTIEHRGPVDPDLRPGLGNRVYGCDDCLAVCPWNKFAVAASKTRLTERRDLRAPPLAALAGLDAEGFAARFSGTPVRRIGRDRMVRNALYAIGNSGDPTLIGVAQARLDDPDAAVADAAGWAIARLKERTRHG